MVSEKFKGIFTALLTPFDSNNKVNEKELEKLVKYNIDMGVKGFYVGWSTAEAFFLNVDEIKNYYIRLADTAALPMLVYHFPTFSGVNMGIGEMSAFLNDDRFAGIKYISNDFFTMEQCKTKFRDKLVYNGFDEMFLSGLSMGADGGIGSTYNFMADKFVKMQKLYLKNHLDEAREIQREANRIIAILCKIGVMQAEKEVLNQLGFDFGICRQPFGVPTDEQKEIIRNEITSKLV